MSFICQWGGNCNVTANRLCGEIGQNHSANTFQIRQCRIFVNRHRHNVFLSQIEPRCNVGHGNKWVRIFQINTVTILCASVNVAHNPLLQHWALTQQLQHFCNLCFAGNSKETSASLFCPESCAADSTEPVICERVYIIIFPFLFLAIFQ